MGASVNQFRNHICSCLLKQIVSSAININPKQFKLRACDSLHVAHPFGIGQMRVATLPIFFTIFFKVVLHSFCIY